jgi:hypothetical protein
LLSKILEIGAFTARDLQEIEDSYGEFIKE